jgi:putative lipoprotein
MVVNRFVLAGLTLLVAQGIVTRAADPEPPKALAGKTWALTRLNGESVDPTVRSTLSVDARSRAAGATGCNRWFGTASFEGASLTFTGVGMTRMACPKPAMDREAAYTRMLAGVRSWKLAEGELILAGEGGKALATFRNEAPPPGRK